MDWKWNMTVWVEDREARKSEIIRQIISMDWSVEEYKDDQWYKDKLPMHKEINEKSGRGSYGNAI